MNDRRRDRSPISTIAFVNVLHHNFPTFMLEIDIDIWRLTTLRRDEPAEQQAVLKRIDRGYFEYEANH